MENRPVLGRLAPSPTGELHLGHAIAFLAAWWSARSQGGKIVLRHEDVDAERAKPEHVGQVETDLRWLGLDWDGPSRLQSEGQAKLVHTAHLLREQGFAYPCTCSRADIAHAQAEILGAPGHGQLERPYPGTCLGRYESLKDAQAASPFGASLRLRVEPGPVHFVDQVYGPQSFDVSEQVGDFHILRRDGTPAYQLAVTLDDYNDGVTEIVRGRDLLPSTARQILIARALQRPYPKVLHLPLVCDSEGRRLSKRWNDLSLQGLRDRGVQSQKVVAFAARCLGQSPEGADPLQALAHHFSPEKIPREDILLPQDPLSLF